MKYNRHSFVISEQEKTKYVTEVLILVTKIYQITIIFCPSAVTAATFLSSDFNLRL
jgi:hypothetical protein